ncbi:peptide/nickel transport system ATP-binding protein [Kineothrix alysoides]|uniref:Peptide/nickel transport system ATP-binding protein n=1 Tax=Kineothrix alysoides TaxID=1469948 RepID=A0A4R1R3W0_9FIRM|nr:ABC transporter ATP-binding protein [Kineothrix alysoides]TCL60060.1 peptide/nickel transport system ATP-binding protein [Kineothrix alysoides]
MENKNIQNKPIFAVSDLSVSYKKHVPVLDHVSFEIERGEILGLVGESGCGKSTLAKAILNMIKHESGEITYDVSKNNKGIRPQMVFQDPYSSLNPVKKVGWILEEPLKLRGGLTKAKRLEKVREMLDRVGLDDVFADRYPRQLSGGQRQRVALAGALMLEPELLIADEPVSALDVTIQAQIIELLLKLHRDMNLSVLFISHDLRVVYQMCDRVMIMKKGEIVEMGKVQEVYFSPKHEYTQTLLEAAGISEDKSLTD